MLCVPRSAGSLLLHGVRHSVWQQLPFSAVPAGPLNPWQSVVTWEPSSGLSFVNAGWHFQKESDDPFHWLSIHSS